MTTDAPQADEPQLRETLVRKLKSFPLSYEQHQLVHDSSFGLLVSHIGAKRRRFTVALFILAAVFAFQAIRGLLASSTYLPWMALAAVAAFWAYRRTMRLKDLRASYTAYADAIGRPEKQENSLAQDLKLGFDLDYAEHKALQAGNAVEAAEGIIARRKANAQTFALGTFAISVAAVAIMGLEGLALVAVLCIGLVVAALLDFATIRKVQRLLDRHSAAPGS